MVSALGDFGVVVTFFAFFISNFFFSDRLSYMKVFFFLLYALRKCLALKKCEKSLFSKSTLIVICMLTDDLIILSVCILLVIINIKSKLVMLPKDNTRYLRVNHLVNRFFFTVHMLFEVSDIYILRPTKYYS